LIGGMNTGACATKPPRLPARQQFEDNQSLASLRRAGPKQNLKPLALIPRPSSAKRAVLGQEPPDQRQPPIFKAPHSPGDSPGPSTASPPGPQSCGAPVVGERRFE